MDKIDFQPKTHLFICTRARENKACCAGKGALDVVKNLKSWIKENQLHFEIKVSQSSCLGYCETGISACLYPQNIWFHNINESDADEIKQMLLNYAK